MIRTAFHGFSLARDGVLPHQRFNEKLSKTIESLKQVLLLDIEVKRRMLAIRLGIGGAAALAKKCVKIVLL